MRHSWPFKGDRCDRAFGGGVGAIPLLHLKNPRVLRKSAATRVARQGVPAHVCNYIFGLDIFGWGGVLPFESVGAKKFSMSFETRGSKVFGGISRDFARAPEKFEKKKLCSILVPYSFSLRKFLTGLRFWNCATHSEKKKKTREGWDCRFQETSRTEGWVKVQGSVVDQGSRQVCLSWCPKS